jgi:hypothetical protein
MRVTSTHTKTNSSSRRESYNHTPNDHAHTLESQQGTNSNTPEDAAGSEFVRTYREKTVEIRARKSRQEQCMEELVERKCLSPSIKIKRTLTLNTLLQSR